MKPDKAEEIRDVCGADMNFSTASYFHVEEKIKEKMGYGYDNMDKFHFVVKVNSVDLPEAVTLSYISKFGVEIDFTYKQDEWSLTGFYYHSVDGKFIREEHTIWSPGA